MQDVLAPDCLEVLTFWFGALDQDGQADAAHAQRWFRKDATFDREIAERFGELHAAVTRGERDHWLATARGRLAMIVVLDQFSRNMFRDSAASLAQDARAQSIALEGMALGQDKELAAAERSFFYMPFMHAEDRDLQDRSVAAFSSWRDELSGPARARVGGLLGYAEQHRSIVHRFGRFPHRNRLLGRESTVEELAFLQGPGSSF